MKNNAVLLLSVSGLLIAVGIIIPMFSPVRIIMEPASFTLASHVVIFIAMFISIRMAMTVSIGTTMGFFFGGFPLVIVLRAASHVVFAAIGAFLLHKMPGIIGSAAKLRLFSFIIALIHSVCELIVVSLFYFGGNMSTTYYQKGFLLSVLLLVGLGTIIHSMIDFEIANAITKVLRKDKNFNQLCTGKKNYDEKSIQAHEKNIGIQE